MRVICQLLRQAWALSIVTCMHALTRATNGFAYEWERRACIHWKANDSLSAQRCFCSSEDPGERLKRSLEARCKSSARSNSSLESLGAGCWRSGIRYSAPLSLAVMRRRQKWRSAPNCSWCRLSHILLPVICCASYTQFSYIFEQKIRCTFLKSTSKNCGFLMYYNAHLLEENVTTAQPQLGVVCYCNVSSSINWNSTERSMVDF